MKWRFFRHLHGGNDPDAEHVYRWHIEQRSGHRMRAGIPTDGWKETVDDYVGASRSLYASMAAFGFRDGYTVPIDPAGELLDASHRVACALALGIETVPVKREARYAWAPDWGYEWFVANGMGHDDLERLCRDFKELTAG